MWIIIKAFNTAVGFKEWLEEKGIKDNNKRQAIAERLIKGDNLLRKSFSIEIFN